MREARLPSTLWSPRSARTRPSRWFVSKVCPGSSVSIDFGQIEVQFVDGASQRVHFFRLASEALAFHVRQSGPG
jgi:hypothetical protein